LNTPRAGHNDKSMPDDRQHHHPRPRRFLVLMPRCPAPRCLLPREFRLSCFPIQPPHFSSKVATPATGF